MNRCSRSEIGISELAHCFSLISTSTILSVIPFSLSLPQYLHPSSLALLPCAIRQLSFAVHFSTSSPFLPLLPPPDLFERSTLSQRCQFTDSPGIESSILHLAASLDFWFEWLQSGEIRLSCTVCESPAELTESPCRRITRYRALSVSPMDISLGVDPSL